MKEVEYYIYFFFSSQKKKGSTFYWCEVDKINRVVVFQLKRNLELDIDEVAHIYMYIYLMWTESNNHMQCQSKISHRCKNSNYTAPLEAHFSNACGSRHLSKINKIIAILLNYLCSIIRWSAVYSVPNPLPFSLQLLAFSAINSNHIQKKMYALKLASAGPSAW